MSRLSYIKESELSERRDLHDIKVLESREDVATLVEVYNDVLNQGISPSAVVGVREDAHKYYYFVVGEKRSLMYFDIVSFIDSRYSSRKVTNANINLLFPQSSSRGLKGEERKARRSQVGQGIPNLLYQKEDLLITVPRDGEVIIGRSEKRANFVVKENENVSRIHCKVFFDKKLGTLKVEDLESHNGTYVNGSKVGYGGEALEVGDTITLAGEKFRVTR